MLIIDITIFFDFVLLLGFSSAKCHSDKDSSEFLSCSIFTTTNQLIL